MFLSSCMSGSFHMGSRRGACLKILGSPQNDSRISPSKAKSHHDAFTSRFQPATFPAIFWGAVCCIFWDRPQWCLMGRKATLVVLVRHGERLDEADRFAWQQMRTHETQYDPPLTKTGWILGFFSLLPEDWWVGCWWTWWFSDFHSYPLVNCYITMEHHHFQWVNPP